MLISVLPYLLLCSCQGDLKNEKELIQLYFQETSTSLFKAEITIEIKKNKSGNYEVNFCQSKQLVEKKQEFEIEAEKIKYLLKVLLEMGILKMKKNSQSFFDGGCFRRLSIEIKTEAGIIKHEYSTSGYIIDENINKISDWDTYIKKLPGIYLNLTEKEGMFMIDNDYELSLAIYNRPLHFLMDFIQKNAVRIQK